MSRFRTSSSIRHGGDYLHAALIALVAVIGLLFARVATDLLLPKPASAQRSGTGYESTQQQAPLQQAPQQPTSLQAINARDAATLEKKFSTIRSKKLYALPIGERVAAVGKLFLGTPYVAGTLDKNPDHESLVIDLSGFDCVTFYENALAIARSAKSKTFPAFEAEYLHQLELLRYRHGKLDGYHSRLHYTTDYFADADMKKVMRIETCEIGKATTAFDTIPIDFMTTHRASYPALAQNDSEFAKIKRVEQDLNLSGGFVYIPKDSIEQVEHGIQTGDILGITTDIPGLDCTHTGIAVREKDGRIHFMHASSLMKKVIITEEPLTEYLQHSKRQTGILVMRPLDLTPTP